MRLLRSPRSLRYGRQLPQRVARRGFQLLARAVPLFGAGSGRPPFVLEIARQTIEKRLRRRRAQCTLWLRRLRDSPRVHHGQVQNGGSLLFVESAFAGRRI